MMTTVMGIAMRAVFCGLLASLAWTSCTSTPGFDPEFTRALARGEPGAGRIEVRDARIETVSAPIAESDLPSRVALAVDAIQPGGTTLAVSRVWLGDGAAFSITKLYGEGAAARQRSVLLSAAGEVIERAHQIPTAEVAASAHRAVTALSRGDIRVIEVVQDEPGVERYRFWLESDDGARFVVECNLAGEQMRVAQRLTAEVRAWQ